MLCGLDLVVTLKNLHYTSGEQFLQLGDYQYNIRGWLTDINSVDPGCAGSTDDLFRLQLRYNTYETFASAYHPPALYNGNIAVMKWQTSDDCDAKAYGYE